ncbi:MAG: hypothetical protein J0H73_13665 [Salana multivorans]|uniref:hypothetical protein n=1 Tax=Salana multivorans TaxID=120377 RepID=UPI00095A7554|nr:hypothetical protein [Salana multivorans]MBN8883347.1 hypothetical protein [Salana multivorans]OJX98433.1 MAG: hypothetical protein BGO96_04535 [Micrococcales bacterium 73-15]
MSALTLAVVPPSEPRRVRRVRDGLARLITTPDQIIRDCQDRAPGRHRHPDSDRIVGIEHHRRMRDLARLIREAADGPSAA